MAHGLKPSNRKMKARKIGESTHYLSGTKKKLLKYVNGKTGGSLTLWINKTP